MPKPIVHKENHTAAKAPISCLLCKQPKKGCPFFKHWLSRPLTRTTGGLLVFARKRYIIIVGSVSFFQITALQPLPFCGGCRFAAEKGGKQCVEAYDAPAETLAQAVDSFVRDCLRYRMLLPEA